MNFGLRYPEKPKRVFRNISRREYDNVFEKKLLFLVFMGTLGKGVSL